MRQHDVDRSAQRPVAIDSARRAGQNLDAVNCVKGKRVQVGLRNGEFVQGKPRHPPSVDQDKCLIGSEAAKVDLGVGFTRDTVDAKPRRLVRRDVGFEVLTQGVDVGGGDLVHRNDLVRLDVHLRSADVGVLGAVADDQDLGDGDVLAGQRGRGRRLDDQGARGGAPDAKVGSGQRRLDRRHGGGLGVDRMRLETGHEVAVEEEFPTRLAGDLLQGMVKRAGADPDRRRI